MMNITLIVEQIILENKRLAKFWSDCYGWAPDNSAELLNRSRLDWHVSLSETLMTWINKDNITNGELILCWANLGALIEGSMKLLFYVYYNDYLKSPIVDRNGKSIDPDILKFEQLKQYLISKNIMKKKWEEYLSRVQGYRNAIHAFRNRDIGTKEIFQECIIIYLDFIKELDDRFPYPY